MFDDLSLYAFVEELQQESMMNEEIKSLRGYGVGHYLQTLQSLLTKLRFEHHK